MRVKRCFDFVISVIAVFLLIPTFLLISVLIKATSKGPIFFKQRRIGKDNKEFIIYKFRTMVPGTPDLPTHLFENSYDYTTVVGNILRKTSLDELPQLINIIKGDMSIVGPRPALYNQYDLIEMRRKNNIQKLAPGLTGWAQINGRDEISIEEKVRLDNEYRAKASFSFDIKIIFLTVSKVISREGIAEARIKPTIDEDIRSERII